MLFKVTRNNAYKTYNKICDSIASIECICVAKEFSKTKKVPKKWKGRKICVWMVRDQEMVWGRYSDRGMDGGRIV